MKTNIYRNLWFSDVDSKGDTKYMYEICILPDNSIIGTNMETHSDSIISGPRPKLAIDEALLWLRAVADATEHKQEKWILVYSLDATQAAAICSAFVAMQQNGHAMDILRTLDDFRSAFPRHLTTQLKDWDYSV